MATNWVRGGSHIRKDEWYEKRVLQTFGAAKLPVRQTVKNSYVLISASWKKCEKHRAAWAFPLCRSEMKEAKTGTWYAFAQDVEWAEFNDSAKNSAMHVHVMKYR